MATDLPDARGLVELVAEHLATRVRPALRGHDAFEAIVAASLLAIAARELDQGADARAREHQRLRELVGREAPPDELEAELVELIRDAPMDGERRRQVLDHLRATAADRLAIANPGYAARG